VPAVGTARRWVRFEHDGAVRFGTLEGETIAIHEGAMFDGARPTSETVALRSVRLLTPTTPTKMIALWNNFGALAKKQQLSTPEHPLYLLKAPNSFLASGETIRRPTGYEGKIVFEAEIGVVIGKTCKDANDDGAAASCIFGYTCVNDVTAIEVLQSDPSFPQWTRAKSYDTFGIFGPVIATNLDTGGEIRIKAILNGEERQNYPLSDMTMNPVTLVRRLSHDMTLYPGDLISCGTSVGVGSMKPGSTIDVVIDGIGTLSNRIE
jgi:2-keto-4-pentenoate hydratase/2-oxohepta-3-ene-1,7-dioic acid hydratase in catechol pathway